MSEIVRVVTELFMMVLCVTSTPVDQQETRIDIVGDRGYVNTMIVQREEAGFTVHDERNGKLNLLMTIVPKNGEENVFICTDNQGESQTVDLGQGIKGLDLHKLRSGSRLRLETIDGDTIAVDRSGEVSYIKLDKAELTYVVHTQVVCLMSTGGGCATSRTAKLTPSVIAVDYTGSLALNGHPTSISELARSLSAQNITTEQAIVITTDRNTPYKHLASVVDELRKNDYRNVSVSTNR